MNIFLLNFYGLLIALPPLVRIRQSIKTFVCGHDRRYIHRLTVNIMND